MHDDQHLVTVSSDLLHLRCQPPPGLARQGPLQLRPAMAGLRLWVHHAGIQVGPLQIGVDHFQQRAHVAPAVGRIGGAHQGLVRFGHDALRLSVRCVAGTGPEGPGHQAVPGASPVPGQPGDGGQHDNRAAGGRGQRSRSGGQRLRLNRTAACCQSPPARAQRASPQRPAGSTGKASAKSPSGSPPPPATPSPSACSVFPKEVPRPTRRWAERRLRNIACWNGPDRGGHFAAWEQPALFAREVRAAARACTRAAR